jgi:hypothetical protein
MGGLEIERRKSSKKMKFSSNQLTFMKKKQEYVKSRASGICSDSETCIIYVLENLPLIPTGVKISSSTLGLFDEKKKTKPRKASC